MERIRILPLVALLLTVGCGGESSDQSPPTPQVGETWYVQDHAYTDEVYDMIKSSGPATYPAQTVDDQPDRSFHLAHPFPCKVTEVGDNGFFKCDVDSERTLDVTSVWTDHLMTAKEADARDPGTVIHKTVAAPAAFPSWLRIKAGQHIYTGYDGGDSNTVTICPSHLAYNDSTSGGPTKCSHKRPGIAAHIVSWENDFTLDSKTNFPVLKIAADDGSWSGYTGSLVSIQPRIPVGTLLFVTSKRDGDVRLHTSKSDDLFKGPSLKNHTAVRLLRQDVADVQNYDLFARIIDGPYAGKTCWLLTAEVEAEDHSPIIMSL